MSVCKKSRPFTKRVSRYIHYTTFDCGNISESVDNFFSERFLCFASRRWYNRCEVKIENAQKLAVTPARKAAIAVAEEGLRAIDTATALRKSVRLGGGVLSIGNDTFPLGELGRLFVVGVGKCAYEGAVVLEEILGDRISAGAVVDVKTGNALRTIKAYAGTHPQPTKANVEAASDVVKLLHGLTERDLVIFLVSGGGSTLLCLPHERGCEEEASVLDALTKSGATIQEINTVRKHLSLARGGYLAKYAYPARMVSLIFSDVPGNDIEFIASGPTVMDGTTIADAETVLGKYDVLKRCGIERCGLVETPKEEEYFERVKNILLVTNDIALDAMARKARELGFDAKICTSCLVGEARGAARRVVEELHATPPKTILLYGGETTVTVKGKGKGGRNLEFALAALPFVEDKETILTVASDGRDNKNEYAGGFSDIITKEHARERGLNPAQFLEENDSSTFFESVGDYIVTGDTGANVSDLIIAIHAQ